MNQSNVNKLYFWPVRSELSLLVFYVPLCAVLCSHLSEVGTSAGAGPDWGSASPLPWWSQPRDSSCLLLSSLYWHVPGLSAGWDVHSSPAAVTNWAGLGSLWLTARWPPLPAARPASTGDQTTPLHSLLTLFFWSSQAGPPTLLPPALHHTTPSQGQTRDLALSPQYSHPPAGYVGQSASI